MGSTLNITLTTEHRGGGSSFSGRPEGKHVRLLLALDDKDNDNNKYNIVIPKGTTAFNPSFFLGLLYQSISRLGIDGFSAKYTFDVSKLSPTLQELIYHDIDEGLRNASNEINMSTGLD